MVDIQGLITILREVTQEGMKEVDPLYHIWILLGIPD